MMEGSGVIKDDVDDNSEYYDWVMIPHCHPEEKKNGITFKGDTADYLRARDIIFEFFNKKGRILTINNRKLQILDIVKHQFKIEVKPLKGQTGKINIKIYPANKSGIATIMITKTKDSELVHVKTLAFKVIRYLIDGIIDRVINEDDVHSFTCGEDEELERRKLICQICRKDFKTKNGMSIHIEKDHGMMNQIDCDSCGKHFISEKELDAHIESEHSLQHKKSCHLCGDSFKTEKDHNEHMKKKHERIKEFECEKCKFRFQDSQVLSEHTAKCGEKEKEKNTEIRDFQVRCDYCDMKVGAENEVQGKHLLSKHHESCSFVPKQLEVEQKFCCKECGFTTMQENVFKRHRRDTHEALTASTSPKPKKRKESPNVELMEVDEPLKDDNEMEIEYQSEILSKLWDEKIIEKNEKINQDEFNLLKEKEEKKKCELLKKDAEKREAEKQKKLRAKLKKKDKKEVAEKSTLKPYLKELPNHIKNIIGDDYFLYPVAGDGACALRSIAGWIFQDPSLGPYLGRNVNEHFVKNWHYWESFFTFPYKRSIGLNGSKVFKNSGELFEFLRSAVDGAFMWRDHQDLAAISNIFKVKIKIITVKNAMDSNPIIHIQEPDPDFKINNDDFPTGKIPDMVLYHVKDVHYDLIVPKESIIAKEGGLDFQRKHNKEVFDEKQKHDDVVKESKELTLEGKIAKMEGLLKVLEEKVQRLEDEKHNRRVESQYTCFECDESFKTKECVRKHMEKHITERRKFEIECGKCDLKYSSEKLLEEHVITHMEDCTSNVEKEEFRCDDCNSQFTSKEYLENHMSKHNKNRCIICGTCFWSESQLEKHIEEVHTENEDQADYLKSHKTNDCENCGEIFMSKEQLEKHVDSDHTSKSYSCTKCKSSYLTKTTFEAHMKSHSVDHGNNEENKCATCQKVFATKVQFVNHNEKQHCISLKPMKQYNCNDCAYQGDSWIELKKHINNTGHKPCDKVETCYNCQTEFSSYRQLMNHRRLEHPSKKLCRYFLKQECLFDEETCWYAHNSENMITKESDPCNELGFQKATKKAPPDQMSDMLRMISNLSLQMKQLQQMGQEMEKQN